LTVSRTISSKETVFNVREPLFLISLSLASLIIGRNSLSENNSSSFSAFKLFKALIIFYLSSFETIMNND
jgi:hypothetical protein